MNKKILIATVMIASAAYMSSCYNNKEDIASLPQVSFRKEVVPIVTGGACGCHNNAQPQRAVQFSVLDTVYHDAILSRVSLFKEWVNGGVHPGEGVVDFTQSERKIVKAWIDQGGKDDNVGACDLSGTITYTSHIQNIYNVSCKGSTCHGGNGPVLDYAAMVDKKSILSTMMNSNGSSGHTAGPISLGSCTISTVKEWIQRGQPQ